MPAIADVFRVYAGAARCLSGKAAGEYLVGSIAPWNYPL